MDFGSVTEFLGNKTILLTGATGFIAKILLEKILRLQPNVNKLYLLIRARDAMDAQARLQDEVLSKELFKVVRGKWGANFESFISEKVTPVAGDTSNESLGLTEDHLKVMYKDIDIVINVAATTKFEERYDVALGVNTLGAKNVVNFAKKCANIQLLIHVSTAYVCGVKEGFIHEKPYDMGETLNGLGGLDIESEKKLAEQTLSNLIANDLPEKTIRQNMKDLGSQRAKFYGWPNTYVFTKAMGEMLVGQLRGNLPVVIMRPTIVCSTLKDPFPGWVEGCRTIDTVAVNYGKGNLHLLPINKRSIYDLRVEEANQRVGLPIWKDMWTQDIKGGGDYRNAVNFKIPADVFVNTIIIAMKAHVNQPCMTIYHVGSSHRNPVTFEELHEIAYHYFTKNPWTNSDGNLVKIRKGIPLNNMLIFEILLFLVQFVVQMVLNLACRMGHNNFQRILFELDKKLKIAMKLVELYKPYLFFKGIFVDTNAEKLLMNARENGLDEDVFYFDPLCINWNDYFINVHIPAVVKYLF